MQVTPGDEPSGPDADPARRAAEVGPVYDEAAGWRPVPDRADWPEIPPEVEGAWLEALAEEGEPEHSEGYPDPDEENVDLIAAECRQAAAEQARAAALAAKAATTGALAAIGAQRRGPGMAGSADRYCGEYAGRAAQFASGMMLDVMPGCPELAAFADEAAGPGDRYDGVSDDELAGILCAWDRLEAHMAARKHAAAAELMRRRAAPGWELEGPARMPLVCEEFLTDELAQVLAVSRWDADELLGLAHDLEVKLPGTKAALLDGILSEQKTHVIAHAVQLLDPEEARAAEALVLDRAGRLTPAGLRSAIARAVMEIAPDKARKRREHAARKARVERWAEHSGNAALVGRELPPAEVLAADQRVSWWARQLRRAGLEGSADELRARAYLDLLLGTDSRPGRDAAEHEERAAQDGGGRDSGQDGGHASGQDGGHAGNPGGPGTPPDGGPPAGSGQPARAGHAAGVMPPGFVGRINLTVPLTTLLGLANRPGEIPGIGPVDPWLTRDLAAAAATNPRTTWCVTVTDQHGYATGHGCARPESGKDGTRREKRGKPSVPGGSQPSGGTGNRDGTRTRDGPGFTFLASGQPDVDGPPGGNGTWRLVTGIAGRAALTVRLDPIAIDQCDHRFQARGHDPGVKLRHLAEIRHSTCTAPGCRRPASQCDFEHNIPYEAGGRSCLCNGGPKCRRDHRLKQHPRWTVEQVTPGTFRWTTPSGRQFVTEPTRYPV